MIKLKLLAFTILSLLCHASFSQTSNTGGTMKISGKVVDESTGNPLVGASVILEGSSTGRKTDVEGNFFFAVEVGKTYAITISNVGYQTKAVNDIQATENLSPLIITMEKSSAELAGVVIKVSARKETVASVYALQKKSSAISDGISAEAIKKSPDKNIGDVLKRVSGASVRDNKFVVIRGLSEKYNAALLNNSILPSTETDKKAFSFNIIPSSVVDNVVIYKSPTPDLPGDFAGGAVKVVTKDYPATSLREISLSVGYNSLTTGKDFYRSYPKGSLDGLGFFDNSRLIPGPYYRHNGADFINQTDAFKQATTKLFPNSYGIFPADKSTPTIGFSYTAGNTVLFKSSENKFGYIYSLGYSNGRNASEKERLDYTLTGSPWQKQYDYYTDVYDQKNNLTALLNLTYSFGASKISLKTLYNNEFVNSTGVRHGQVFENTDPTKDISLVKSLNSEATGSGILNSVLEGVHKLKSSWNLDWNTSFGYTYKNQPDQRILGFRTAANNTTDYFLGLANENSPEISSTGRVYSFLNENIYGVSANVSKDFKWGQQTQTFKFGAMNYYRDRMVEVDALGYATLSAFGKTIYETSKTTYSNIFSAANIDNYRITVANIPLSSTSYTGNALSNAGYIMMNNNLSSKFKVTWGARVEHYEQSLEAAGKSKRDYSNTDVLPSALFTYALNNKTNLRLAGSQSVNRPEFRELADYRSYDYDNNITLQGNPNLVRSKNTNADLRYEWFPSSGEIISGSLFYKYFDQPIEQQNLSNNVFSYANADHSTVYGAEIEVRKNLSFINDNDFLHRLVIYANAAYLKGSVQIDGVKVNSPMQGQSPYLINGGLFYSSNNDAFSANVLYNRVGPRLLFRSPVGAALNIFEKPRDILDAQITQKILHKKLELKLTVSDILAQPFKWYYKQDAYPSDINYKSSDDIIIASNRFGTTVSLALKYNF